MGSSCFLPQISSEIVTSNCMCVMGADPWWRCPVNDKYDIYSTLYGPQIARWMMLFHPSQFIFINYEELVQVAFT